MTLTELYENVLKYFIETQPEPTTELDYMRPYELIVAVLLSAQCTDKRVNVITPKFFQRFPSPEVLAMAEVAEVYEVIRSCSYPNNKAKHLVGMAQKLVNEFGGIVPTELDKLQTLPGVGRKSANVVAGVAFGKDTMPVDTHVFRVSARIGLTVNAKNPLDTEKQLVANIPKHFLSKAHHWLILHGRYVCQARKPKCAECGIRTFCQYDKKNEN